MWAPLINNIKREKKQVLSIEPLKHLISSPNSVRQISGNSEYIFNTIVKIIDDTRDQCFSTTMAPRQTERLSRFFINLNNEIKFQQNNYAYKQSIKQLAKELLEETVNDHLQAYLSTEDSNIIHQIKQHLDQQIDGIKNMADDILHSHIADRRTTLRSKQQLIAINTINNIKHLVLQSEKWSALLDGKNETINFFNKLLAHIQSSTLLSYKNSYGKLVQATINNAIGKLFDQHALKYLFNENETHLIATLQAAQKIITTIINNIEVKTTVTPLGSSIFFQEKNTIADSVLSVKLAQIRLEVAKIKNAMVCPKAEIGANCKTIENGTYMLTYYNELNNSIRKLSKQKTFAELNTMKQTIKKLFMHCNQPHKYIKSYCKEIASLLEDVNNPRFITEEEKYIKQLSSPTTTTRKQTLSASITGHNCPYI